MSLNNAGVEHREQLLDWQQMYQLSLPLREYPTPYDQPSYTAHHQQQNPDYAYGPATYLTADPFRQLRNPRPDTQPWQQPPDLPDWQRNPQPQPYDVAQNHAVAAVFSADTYTVLVTMAPPRTSLTDNQTRLNEYTQSRTTSNISDWYNFPALIHGQPNHNPNFGGIPPHQFQQPQH